MTSDELSRAGLALFDQVVDMEPAARNRELDRITQAQPELRRYVDSLLQAADAAQSNSFLTGPKPSGDAAEPDFEFHPGDQLGLYRLECPLGRGGMGEVWLAHRTDGAYDAPVALKVLHGYLAAGTGRERFIREGRILGSLSHPSIARMLDAGIGAQGQHFLVIEHVDGVPVTRWCDEHSLDVEGRIRLFLEICSAVAYAHSHLVVHRDLKPSNILVTGDGQVKLLDFGIAKLLEPERAEADSTELTRAGGGLLTPDYAAPEQVLGEAITTATDVYALGVLLFRLLTGRHPYGAVGRTAAQATYDVLRSDPRAASDVVSRETTTGVSAEDIAALRAATPRTLSRALRGDLDVIVGKTLRKEPAARYADARALADDLDRFLKHEPVRAREGARAYVWRRFIRRNWLALSVIAGFVVLLLAGVAAIVWQAEQTRREAQRAGAVTDFLISVFRASDPRIAQDKPRSQITARELLDSSASRIATNFASDPDTQIKLLGVTADIYRELDDEEHYTALHEQQIRLARKLYGDLHPAVIDGLLTEAFDAENKYDYKRAQSQLSIVDPLIRRAGLDGTVTRARWLLLKGESYTADSSQWSQRERYLNQSVQLYEHIGPTDPGYVKALSGLGELAYDRDQLDQAVTLYQRAIAAADQVSPRNDAQLLDLYEFLALSYHFHGDLDPADTTYQKASALALQTYGDHHRRYWRIVADHARLVHERGDRERALRMFADLERLMPKELTPNGEVAEARYNHAASLVEEGQPALAIPVLEAVARFYRERPMASYVERRNHAMLGDAYDLAGHAEEARHYLKAALDGYVAEEAADSDSVMDSRERWGRFLLTHGDDKGAEAQFGEVVGRKKDRIAAGLILAQCGLARVALVRNDSIAALATSQKAMKMLDHVTGLIDARAAPYVWNIYAQALLVNGDARTAREWAARALDADRRYDGDDSVYVKQAESTLRGIDAVLEESGPAAAAAKAK